MEVCVEQDKDYAHNTVNTVRNVHPLMPTPTILHPLMPTPTILDGSSTVRAYRVPLVMNTLDYRVEQVLYPFWLACLYHWLSCYSWW